MTKYTDDLLHHPVEMLPSGEVRCKLCHGQWPDAITAFEHISTDHPRYAHEIRERYGIWIGPKRDEEYYGDQADLRDDDSFSSKSIFRRGVVARELRKRLPVNDLPYIEIFADMVRVKVPVMMLPKAMASLWGQSKLIGGDPFDPWEDHDSLFEGDEAYRRDYNDFRFGRNQKRWEGYYDPDEWHDVKKYRSRNSFLKGD